MKKNKWISVKDKLPDENTSVFVFIKTVHDSFYKVMKYRNNMWDDYNSSITHWKKVPKKNPIERNKLFKLKTLPKAIDILYDYVKHKHSDFRDIGTKNKCEVNAMVEYTKQILDCIVNDVESIGIQNYQLCPKCLGEGKVPTIGGTSSFAGLYRICPVCNSNKMIGNNVNNLKEIILKIKNKLE